MSNRPSLLVIRTESIVSRLLLRDCLISPPFCVTRVSACTFVVCLRLRFGV